MSESHLVRANRSHESLCGEPRPRRYYRLDAKYNVASGADLSQEKICHDCAKVVASVKKSMDEQERLAASAKAAAEAAAEEDHEDK